MEILVNVSNQKLKITSNLKSLVAGTQKFIKFKFYYHNDDWNDLATFAQFAQNGRAYNIYLDEDNSVELPPEIVAGKCTLMLYGTKTVSDNGEQYTVRATTNIIELTINENMLIDNAIGVELTQTLYEQLLANVKSMVGHPFTAKTVSEMSEPEKVYVYTGNEPGYTAGKWYYHNGTNWVPGGIYNSVAASTDKTLSLEDEPADSKIVGIEINNIKSQIPVIRNMQSNLQNEIAALYVNSELFESDIDEKINDINDSIDRLDEIKADESDLNDVLKKISNKAEQTELAGLYATVDSNISDIEELKSNTTKDRLDIIDLRKEKANINDLAGLHTVVAIAEIDIEDLKQDTDYLRKSKAEQNDLAGLFITVDSNTNDIDALKPTFSKAQEDICDLQKTKANQNDLSALYVEHDINKYNIELLRKTKAEQNDLSSLYIESDINGKKVSDLQKSKASHGDLEGLYTAVDFAELDIQKLQNTTSILQGNIANVSADSTSRVLKPINNPNGVSGQLLQTNGDGTTSWINPYEPSAKDISDAVTDWLDEHPEATTTITDGSITEEKLSQNLKESISNNAEATDALIMSSELFSLFRIHMQINKEIQYKLYIYNLWKERLKEYAGHFTQTDGIGFLFFTDPHSLSDRFGSTPYSLLEDFKYIKAVYENTPAKWVICGGDWENTNHELADAMLWSGRLPNLMREEISQNAYTVIGNHDGNREGGIGTLTPEQISKVWFDKHVGYYILESEEVACYMLDMGYSRTMSAYQETECEWFATKLLSNEKDHIFCVGHIPCGIDGVMLGGALTEIANAFNQKTSITRNNIVYDYTNAHGTVHFFIGGHVHHDDSSMLNNIPIILTDDFAASLHDKTRAIDCCFADFHNAKLYCVRVGKGESREFDIIPNNGYQIVS